MPDSKDNLITIRCRPELKREVEKRATRNGRSLNQEAERLILMGMGTANEADRKAQRGTPNA